MYRALALVLALALPLASAVSVASTERLTEKSIRTPGGGGASAASNGGEGPERISGYFKLDRTKDAHMFYFLFQSRSMKPDDPVVLWMTGACDDDT